jgi:hypothetical protein
MVKILCFYTIQKSTAETRGPKVPKRLFFFVCGAFIFQPYLMIFFPHVNSL